MSFHTKLNAATKHNRSFVCVGLDPDPGKLPEHLKGQPNAVLSFLKEIVSATQDLACAFKPNFAFYGALGKEGWEILEGVIQAVPKDVPVLLDFKAGDIGNTAAAYARMAYETLGADAVTVNPYMGQDAVEPFLKYTDRCAFLLCLTSNPGSADFQRQATQEGLLYQVAAQRATIWNETLGPCGLVVGATHPEELGEIRTLAPRLPFLVPGVGAQGGEAAAVVRLGLDEQNAGLLVNASRSILYASSGKNFAEEARSAAEALRNQLEKARPGLYE